MMYIKHGRGRRRGGEGEGERSGTEGLKKNPHIYNKASYQHQHQHQHHFKSCLVFSVYFSSHFQAHSFTALDE